MLPHWLRTSQADGQGGPADTFIFGPVVATGSRGKSRKARGRPGDTVGPLPQQTRSWAGQPVAQLRRRDTMCEMNRRRVAALVLLCALPLLLPRGWCCIVAGPVNVALARLAPSYPECCPRLGGQCCECSACHCQGCSGGGCCSCAPRTPRADTGQPDRPGPPRPFKRCPCAGRDTTLPSGPKQVSPDLPPPQAVAELALPGDALATFVGAAPALPSLRPPPLHVLKCLWLC
jgi:hypothetical protein